MNIRKAPLLALITLALATTAAAQLTPAHARGFDPEKVYQVGDLDHINLFNGNLILSLPIGPTLPVGGNLSYGLHLVYNGNPWNYGSTMASRRPSPAASATPAWDGSSPSGSSLVRATPSARRSMTAAGSTPRRTAPSGSSGRSSTR